MFLNGPTKGVGHGLEFVRVTGVAEFLRDGGEGGVFLPLEGVHIAGEEKGFELGNVGVCGVIVSAGLHGIVPKEEASGLVEVGLFPPGDDFDDIFVFLPEPLEAFGAAEEGGLGHEGLEREVAALGCRLFGGHAAGRVANFAMSGEEVQDPVAKVFRLGIIRPVCEVGIDEKTIPVPKLVVKPSRDPIGMFDKVSFLRRAQSGGAKTIEVFGDTREKRHPRELGNSGAGDNNEEQIFLISNVPNPGVDLRLPESVVLFPGKLVMITPVSLIRLLGHAVLELIDYLGQLGLLVFEMFVSLTRGEKRYRQMMAQIAEIGARSQVVVGITGAFTGAVLAAQALFQFKIFNLETAAGGLVSVAMLRELGPTITGLMLAGRVGSAMAAEIGTMKVTEQVDALRSMAVHPIDYLVTPRLVAMVLSVPLLIAESAALGIIASYVIGVHVFGVEAAYWNANMVKYADWGDLSIAIIKGLSFGILIVVISCHQGLKASNGAVGVGRGTTNAMVFSSLAILIVNFFLTLLVQYFFPADLVSS